MTDEKGIFAENTGGEFEQIEPGSYVARAYKMVDIGTQRVKDFSTDDINLVRQVLVYWELLEDENNDPVRMKDGRPFSIQKRYRLSMHPKASLRKDLDAWRGISFTKEESERFNITKLLGTYCRLSAVTSKDGKYTNVDAIAFTKRKPEGVNDTFWWSAVDPDRDMDAFEKFPDWLKQKIQTCNEWSGQTDQEKEESKAQKAASTIAGTDAPKEPIDLSEIPF